MNKIEHTMINNFEKILHMFLQLLITEHKNNHILTFTMLSLSEVLNKY